MMSLADLPLWAALPVALLLVAGGLISLLGTFGLLCLDNFYARAHAPTMGNTLGAACVLLASIIVSSLLAGRLAIHEVLIAVFLLVTSPVTTIILMRAARSRDSSDTH